MSTPNYSLIALAVLQACAASALAQTAPQAMPEVVISGSKTGGLERAAVAGFSDAPLLQTPASVSVFGREQMQDLRIRSSSDAMHYDASVSDSYNAVGYAEQFSIRGFVLDNTSSYRKDGFAIPGDTQIPLENKERIEVLKGLAGLQAGVAAPGGIINYVTKRATDAPLRQVTLEVSERGTLYGSIDLGGRFDDKRFGYRVNAANERLRSYVKGADGKREFVSGAFDWQISPQALLQLDMDYQHKSQISAPGYQLIGGTALPSGVSPDTLLNAQPWSKPVDTVSRNLGLRFAYQFNADWHASIAANKHWFKRDDYTAFPYGCGAENLYPGYCANGDYDVYDYQSVGESKSPLGVQAQLQGKFATGAFAHALTVGASLFERHDKFGNYVYALVGTSNIYHNVIVPPSTDSTGPVTERRTEHERALFVQDVVTLTPQTTLHAGLRYVQVKRDEVVPGAANAQTDSGFVLPNIALVYSPQANWSVYGALAHGLEHGGIAPVAPDGQAEITNANQALSPSRSKQFELGTKAELGHGLNVAAALFQIRKGLEYTDATPTYVRNGVETHRGLELTATARASAELRVGVSLTAMNTKQEGTGQADTDGKRVTDVPNFKSTSWFDYKVAALPGLTLNGSWNYAGSKAFDRANTVNVPSYHLLNLGGAYLTQIGGVATTVRVNVDNVFDKFYWRDVTPALGGYLLPGASRVFKVSAQFDF